jgi:hypothetical protein
MGKAARLFNGRAEQTLIARLTPSQEQRKFLQQQWNEMADYLKLTLSEQYVYPISTWLQGSYKFGTLIKPVHKGEEYDVDVGLHFERANDGDVKPSPGQLRDWVQQALITYQRKKTQIREVIDPSKERCSRACFDAQFHIDIPVYWFDPSSDSRQLATLSKWENSDPKAIYLWFKSFVGQPERDQLRRLVRYFKGWAAVAFEGFSDSRPSSMVLTVLVSEAYDEEGLGEKNLDDEDTLIAIVQNIYARLGKSSEVRNPVDGTENLNRIQERHWPKFMENLDALQDAAERADNSEEESGAALAWSEAFSFLMPLPETDEVEVVDASGRALMVLPNIQIDVYARKPERHLATHMNEVPSVSKNCDLKFRITNPHVLPPYAKIEWTVRNAGQEAETVGDLGHTRKNAMGIEAEESTSYFGKHYMDCVIRLNGDVIAVRRVPVSVRSTEYPARNPPKPPYTKILTQLRRR